MSTSMSTSTPHGSFVIPNGVLIVDDQEHMRDILRELVEGLDLPAFTAADHRAAMQEFSAHRDSIGLVLTDLKMDERNVPDSAGAELIDWLTRGKARCRIGVFTAFGEMADLANKTRNPIVAFYLPKTGDPKDLEVVERHVLDALDDYSFVVRADIPALTPAEAARFREAAAKENGYGNWTLIAGGRAGSSYWEIDEPIGAVATPNAGLGRVAGTVGFQLGDVRYRTVATTDGVYVELAGDGLRVLGRPGTPALPISTQRLALPGPLYDLSAEIEEDDWFDVPLSANWDGVLPVPEPQIEGQPARYVVRKAYWQPGTGLLIGRRSLALDGVACATVGICPFRYEPRTRVFQMLRSARIRVCGTSVPTLDSAGPVQGPDPSSPLAHQILGWPDADAGLRRDGPPLDGMDGPTGGGPAGSGPSGGRRTSRRRRYLAVGTAENLEAIQPLLTERGKTFDVQRLRIGQDGNPPVNASPDQRAQWILDQLDRRSLGPADKPHYVLLAGGDETIPFYRYPAYRSYDGDPIQLRRVPLLSDLWYAKFDRDSEGSVPRYALGRLPFDNPARLHAYCQRIVGAPGVQPWRHWLFLCGLATNHDYQGNVKKIIDANHTAHRLVSGCMRGPAFAEPIDSEHVDRLFAQEPSVASFRGHGLRYCWWLNEDLSWPDDTRGTASLAGLNGIVSVACCTATPDLPRPGCGACTSVDRCMQHQPLGLNVLDSGGAFWFLGSTRPSFTLVNDVFHEVLMKEICRGEVFPIGDVHRAAVVELLKPRDAAPDAERANSCVLDTAAMSILLGDPAAPIGSPS